MAQNPSSICSNLSIEGPGFIVVREQAWKPGHELSIVEKLPLEQIAALWSIKRTEYLFNDAASYAREEDDPSEDQHCTFMKAEARIRGHRTFLDVSSLGEDDEIRKSAIRVSDAVVNHLQVHEGLGSNYEKHKLSIIRSQGPVLLSQDEHCDSMDGWSVDDPEPTLSVIVQLTPYVVYLRSRSHRRTGRSQVSEGVEPALDDREFVSQPIKLDVGDALVMRGDLIHSGSGWVVEKVRFTSDGALDVNAPGMYSMRLFFFLSPVGRGVENDTHFINVKFSHGYPPEESTIVGGGDRV